MEPISRPPRYVTLRDYLAVVRRNWIAIVLIAAVGAGAGLADAKRQTPEYQATAAISFEDPAQDLPLVGLGTSFVQTPAELAATSAETLTRSDIMSRVRRNLHSHQPVNSLAGGVSGSVSTAGLLEIVARWSNPGFAARLANSVAAVEVAQANRAARASFAHDAAEVRRQVSSLQSGSKPSGASAATQVQVLEVSLARLVTLSNFAQTAQVAQIAQAPASPSSPRPIRSAVIGLVLGLLLAIALAFVRDILDRRLRTSDDIEASFRFPVLGHIRKKALGKVVHAEARRSHDYRVDIEAFRILRRNLEFLNLDSPPRSVVVTSAVPEEGKTTVASSLAFATAAAGKRTLLIEGDLRRPDLAGRLEIERSPGLSDYLMGEKASTEITRRVQVMDPPSQNGKTPPDTEASSDAFALTVVPAGSPTAHGAELLGSRRFKQFIEKATAAYDVVIIDSSPLLPVADTLEILPAVDAVIVCARESKTKREEALAARSALERFPDRPVGVVVTGVRPSRHDSEVYSYSYGYS
jgi:Mrp family chromosome partitioning ATPase